MSIQDLEELQKALERHISFSDNSLALLRDESYHISRNALEDGTRYLDDAHSLLRVYQRRVPGPIDDECMLSINDTLKELGYEPTETTTPISHESQVPKYFNLLKSESRKDFTSFLDTVESNIAVPAKRLLTSINLKLQSAIFENLIQDIKNDNHEGVEYFVKRGDLVNYKDDDGRTALHYAVDKGTSIVEVILKNLSPDERIILINTRTNYNGTTSLHIAAEKGYLRIVKSLLQHGATHNIRDKNDKTPLDVSKDPKVSQFLQSVEQIFGDIKIGKDEAIDKIKAIKLDDGFLALTNSRNEEGHVLLRVAMNNGHKKLAIELLEMMFEEPWYLIQSRSNDEIVLDQLQMLGWASEDYFNLSEVYLTILRTQMNPRHNLKNGTYYLDTTFRLIELYNGGAHLSIDNGSLKRMNDTMMALEFHPEDIDLGHREFSVSQGKGKMYHTLLHGGVRSFLEIVGMNIDSPIKKFVGSIDNRLRIGLSKKLLGAIKNNNLSEVKDCIKRGLYVDFEDDDLKTPLHAASAKDCGEILEVILKHVSPYSKIEFINAKTRSDGTASLHLAAQNGLLENVKCLVKHGANRQIQNKEGKIPVDLSNDQEVRKFLNSVEPTKPRVNKGKTLLDQLEKLKDVSECLMTSFDVHITVLQRTLQPYISEKNTEPRQTLEAGSSYLSNAHYLVEVYKQLNPGPIDDERIQSVIDLLKAVEFDPTHPTQGDLNEAFFNVRVPIYYKLLHTEDNKDVRSFLEKIQHNIEKPVKRFLHSINERLECVLFERLLDAINQSNLSEVRRFIMKGAQVNFRDPEGRTSLHYAVDKGKINIVSTLLRGGAEVTVTTNKNNTPLHLAASKGDVKIVKLLLDRVHPNYLITFIDTKTNFGGTTALHVAAEKGYSEIVECLVKYGATRDIKNKDGKRPVDLSKDKTVCEYLKPANPAKFDLGCDLYKLEELKNDIEKHKTGFNVNLEDSEGKTPLYYAVEQQNLNIVNFLLEKGAKVTGITEESNNSLLHLASSKGDAKIVKVLLEVLSPEEKINFINAGTSCGFTSLHLAAKNGFLNVVQCLLTHGAFYNIGNRRGKTPINVCKDEKVVKFLRLVGDIFKDIRNNNFGAIGKLEALELCEFEAIANARDKEGNDLLRVALNNGRKDLASELLRLLNERV